jgi:hypothetical protein
MLDHFSKFVKIDCPVGSSLYPYKEAGEHIDGLGVLGRRYGSRYGMQVGRRRVRV